MGLAERLGERAAEIGSRSSPALTRSLIPMRSKIPPAQWGDDLATPKEDPHED
jgi:hypothetical protein